MTLEWTDDNCKIFSKCIFYIFKMGGIATMSLTIVSTKNKSCKVSLGGSKIGISYNLFLIGIIAILNYFNTIYLYNDKISEKFERKQLIRIVSMAQTAVAFCVIVALLVIFCIRQKGIIDLANKLNFIRKTTLLVNNRLPLKNKILMSKILKIFSINGVTAMALLATSPRNSHYIMYDVMFYFCTIMIQLLLAQYTIFLESVKHIFAAINDKLLEVSKKVSKRQAGYCRMEMLFNLQKLYSRLSDLSLEFAEFYSAPMLLAVVFLFLTLLLYAYYVTTTIVHGISDLKTLNYNYIAHWIVVLVLNLTSLTMLTKSVADTMYECKTTGTIVNDAAQNVYNDEVIMKFNEFFYYLLHKKVEFKIFHLFSLDQPLLMTFVGSITTYLVILMEFQSVNVTSSNRTAA